MAAVAYILLCVAAKYPKSTRAAQRRKKAGKRKCATDGCETYLSSYNKGKCCFACDNPRDVIRPTLHPNRS
jgi:hypothetical protein